MHALKPLNAYCPLRLGAVLRAGAALLLAVALPGHGQASANVKAGTDTKPPATSTAMRKAGGQASFCTPTETVVFACRTGAKMVSVCASKDASATKGYLQYRFGKPDSAEPLELSFPDDHRPPSRVASGRNEPYAGGGGSWLRMRRGEYVYGVYTGIGRWGPQGQTLEKQGLVVQRGDKVVATLRCTGPLTSELGPDWFETMGVKSRDDEEFIFP